MKVFSRIYTVLIFVLLYAPIALMLLMSFNSGKSLAVFQGFSLRWYRDLFSNAAVFNALRNTLVLAVCASAIATVIGTMAALGMHYMRRRHLKDALHTVTSIPMMNPDIVTGVSLMLLFVFFGKLFRVQEALSFWTILCAHVTFCLPYVILSVLPRFRQMDRHLTEAAMDLGCTPMQAFFKVELPNILPGVLTGALMCFTLSLDDFIISYFTTGNDFQTLPILIYSLSRKGTKPDMYALASLIFVSILLLLLLNNYMQGRSERQLRQKNRPSRRTRRLGARDASHSALSE